MEPNKCLANPRKRPLSRACWLTLALLATAMVLVAGQGCSRGFILLPRAAHEKTAGVHLEAFPDYLRGFRAEQAGDWEAARESYASARELDPDSTTVLTRLAVSTYEAGKVDEAKPLLAQAEEAARQDPELAIILARFFDRQKRTDEASRYYEIAAQRDDLKFAALLDKARMLEHAGDAKHAEETYLALAEQTGNPKGRIILGEYYMRGGRYEAALKEFNETVETQPYVHQYIAVCQAESGDIDGAIASLETYREHNCPTGPTGLPAETPQASPVYEAADSVHGGSPWEPFRRVAEIAMSKNMPAKAVRALETAFGCGGDAPELWESLGDAYHALGQDDKARDAWNKALEKAAQDGEKDRLRQKLDSLEG